jgi:hypothetical protein
VFERDISRLLSPVNPNTPNDAALINKVGERASCRNGQTGHATGPHLHFDFLRGGTKINFLDLRISKNQHLAVEDLPRFNQLYDQRQAMLRKENERVAEDTQPAL